MPQLANIRRIEAASFRSFPAASTHFDGTWAIRLTAAHPAKRLNSISPLDPGDHKDMERRIGAAEHRFSSFGRPLVFRLSPLAPARLGSYLVDHGWQPFDESIVMLLNLSGLALDNAVDRVPLKDTGAWVDAFIELSGEDRSLKPGLAEIIEATEPETGLFVHADMDGRNVSAARCVCDRDLAGLFDIVTREEMRGRGHGRNVVLSALSWARRQGARQAWLQVVAENGPAVHLYESLGFREVYRYVYWQHPRERQEDGKS